MIGQRTTYDQGSCNRNIFRHLKLEIALAIPASNEEKILADPLAGQGLEV